MSLINDALKKAARQRAEDQAEVAPLPLAAGRKRIPRKGAPMTVKALVLLVGGAAVLIVASVIVTFVFVAGKSGSKAAAADKAAQAQATPPPSAAVAADVPAPVVSIPQPSPAPPTAAPVVELPSPTPIPVAPAVEIPVVAVSAPPAAPVKAALPALSRGDRIQAFVDGLRVTGVRTAGSDSKALVDGHVYRVDDILDRPLGIKLVKVDADHLTLIDSGGVTYIKNF